MSFNYSIIENSKSGEFTLKIEEEILGESLELDELFSQFDNFIKQKIIICTIDLEQVNYMDSSGLSILLKILTKFRNIGGEVYLSSISEQVKKLLMITKLNSIFEIK